MTILFLCECRRFARPILAFGSAHLVAIFLIARVTNPLQWKAEDQLAILFLFMLYGCGLAFVQMGAYNKPSQWLWLIHRPLSPQHTFRALFGSAAFVLTAALFAPLAIWLVATDLFTTEVVDVRDYMSLIHLLVFALMAWLIGTLTLLCQRPIMLLSFSVPVLFAVQMISVWWLTLSLMICTSWLFYVASSAFKADRDAPIRSNLALVLTALPLQISIFLLTFHVGKATLEVAQYLRSPPLPSDVVTEEEAQELPRSPPLGLLAQGLAVSQDPRAHSWRAQLPLLPGTSLLPVLARFPVRHQFGNIVPVWWDEKRGIQWIFSHDSMRYEGRNPRNGAYYGSWGRTGVPTGCPID